MPCSYYALQDSTTLLFFTERGRVMIKTGKSMFSCPNDNFNRSLLRRHVSPFYQVHTIPITTISFPSY